MKEGKGFAEYFGVPRRSCRCYWCDLLNSVAMDK